MALSWASSHLFLMDVNHVLASGAYYHCYSTGNFSSNSEYGNNRDGFLSSMPSDISNQKGFYYTQSVTYATTTAILYCLGLCRPDLVFSDSCSTCISKSSSAIITNCPVQMEVIAWDQDARCLVRCAPHDFPSSYESQPTIHACSSSNMPLNYLPQFGRALANLTHSVAQKTADDGSKSFFATGGGDRPKYFATEESDLGHDVNLTVYALGFCLPTLSKDSCVACLQAAANQSEENCSGKKGATIFTPSCVLRYQLYRFYNQSSLVFSVPSPSPPSPQASNVKKESQFSGTIVAAIVLPVIVVLIVIASVTYIIVNYILKKRMKNKEDEVYLANDDNDATGVESIEPCIEFNFNTLRVATDDFSTNNKLGQGGFGTVYKGRLPNGRQIAVKRLAVHSGRREGEFKNEVQLVARLHHKNLVRLLGFCLRGKERILIYELAVNGSLDRFLFDPIRRELLTWEIRYNIIEGIARGMLYLHEESQLRIIHRDLKASNILLNESFTPKISDFGTARLFVEDQSSASRIVGTYGYMPPEYVKYGKISVKIDVFSFGVLMLEIVCGKKNSASENPNDIEHLLSKAWIYWTEGKVVKLIDPILVRANGDREEITRCVHIGLLCVQQNAGDRPSMNSVILMLEAKGQGCSESLPPPLKPAFFMETNNGDDEPVMVRHQHGSVLSESQQTTLSMVPFPSSGFSSVNEASLTQPYPEPR